MSRSGNSPYGAGGKTGSNSLAMTADLMRKGNGANEGTQERDISGVVHKRVGLLTIYNSRGWTREKDRAHTYASERWKREKGEQTVNVGRGTRIGGGAEQYSNKCEITTRTGRALRYRINYLLLILPGFPVYFIGGGTL